MLRSQVIDTLETQNGLEARKVAATDFNEQSMTGREIVTHGPQQISVIGEKSLKYLGIKIE
jgi:hypothetical protein